jgi:hypothetical protein
MKTTPSPDPDIIEAIRDIVERETGRFGLESLQVEVANDNDGDPVLEIAAGYAEEGEPVEMQVLLNAMTQVRERLLEMGEERFPHIRYKIPDTRRVAG